MDLNNKTIRLAVGRSPGVLPVLLTLVVFGFAFSLGGSFGHLFIPWFSPIGEAAWQADQRLTKNLSVAPITAKAAATQAAVLKNISQTGPLIDPLSQNWSDHLASFRYAILDFGDFLWQSSADYLSFKLDLGMGLLARLWSSVTGPDPAWVEDLSTKGQDSGVKILSVGEAKIRAWNMVINQNGANLNLALVSETKTVFNRVGVWVLAPGVFLMEQLSRGLGGFKNIFTEQVNNTKTEISLSTAALANLAPVLIQTARWPIQTLVAALATWPEQIALSLANQSDQLLHFSRQQSSQLASLSAGSAQFSREELKQPIVLAGDLKSLGQTGTIKWWSQVANWTARTKDNAKLGLTYSFNQAQALAAVRLANLSFSWPEWQAFLGDRFDAFVTGVQAWWQETISLALNNWRYFLGWGKSPVTTPAVSATSTGSSIDTKALEEKIKADVRDQLKQELSQIIRQTTANNISASGQSGLVVMPSTGTATGDENLKNQIQAMFSDRVSISFDANRKAGVVAPVFAPPGSDNYIFLLAPIKK